MLPLHRRHTDGQLVAQATNDVTSVRVKPCACRAFSSRQLGEGQRLPEVAEWTKEVTIEELIGSGGFGAVYRATMGGRRVAVKKLHWPCRHMTAQFLSYLGELRALNLSHPHLLHVIRATPLSAFSERAWLLMEWGGQRDLTDILTDMSEFISLQRRLCFAWQITSGLSYMHSQGLLHLDVKPGNVLVDRGDYCRLTDFGCCQTLRPTILCDVSSPRLLHVLQGTLQYRAPELLRGESPRPPSDVFSMGITLWQLASRHAPYQDQNSHQAIYRVVAFDLRPQEPDICLDDPREAVYRNLYVQCWHRDPVERPACSDLLQVLDLLSTTAMELHLDLLSLKA